jgi:HJR/Mrr/RecB family endonuclease
MYEEVIASLFRAMGYIAKVKKKTGDYGVDVICTQNNSVIAVQVKRYSAGNNVGNRDVQRLLGAMQYREIKANKAVLVTTSDFTVAAIEQAKENPIELWNGQQLSELLEKYSKHITADIYKRPNK